MSEDTLFEMKVYVNGRPTIVETNPAAIAFWKYRKRVREMDGVRITWKIKGDVPARTTKDPLLGE